MYCMIMNIHKIFFKWFQKQKIINVKHIISIMNLSTNRSDSGARAMTLLHHVKTAEVCRELIQKGALVNARDPEGRTPLHHAILYKRGFEIVKQLLRSGADTNACDDYKCTPLIIAIQLLGNDALEVVKELLDYGANPNVHDYQGYSALTLAMYKNDLKVIQEMLECGADANFRNNTPHNHFLMYITPMTEAVQGNDRPLAELIIKVYVMKYFDYNFREMIDLDRFNTVLAYRELSSFIEECACEVYRMKSFVIHKKYQLLEFIVKRWRCYKPLYIDDYTIKDIPSLYPIYQDIILSKLEPHSTRAHLLNKITNLLLYVGVCNNESGNECRGKKVYLNADCSCKIAEYLDNNELAALVKAYSI